MRWRAQDRASVRLARVSATYARRRSSSSASGSRGVLRRGTCPPPSRRPARPAIPGPWRRAPCDSVTRSRGLLAAAEVARRPARRGRGSRQGSGQPARARSAGRGDEVVRRRPCLTPASCRGERSASPSAAGRPRPAARRPSAARACSASSSMRRPNAISDALLVAPGAARRPGVHAGLEQADAPRSRACASTRASGDLADAGRASSHDAREGLESCGLTSSVRCASAALTSRPGRTRCPTGPGRGSRRAHSAGSMR